MIEDGLVRRVGSLKERRVDVRLLAATNRNLVEEVVAGRFREDLYYRINVMSLELPPLRRREGDIPLLVRHFLGATWGIEDAALDALCNYPWPGNVRQLINVLERAKIMSDDDAVRLVNLPKEILAPTASLLPDDLDDLASIEKTKVQEILEREGGNKTRAARVLGIDRRKLYRLLDKYGMS